MALLITEAMLLNTYYKPIRIAIQYVLIPKNPRIARQDIYQLIQIAPIVSGAVVITSACHAQGPGFDPSSILLLVIRGIIFSIDSYEHKCFHVSSLHTKFYVKLAMDAKFAIAFGVALKAVLTC